MRTGFRTIGFEPTEAAAEQMICTVTFERNAGCQAAAPARAS
jgi:hypothetical protein